MRRADRLFRLVGLLQRRRTVTAAALAERLEVSERTVYRDIADLIGSGVPIAGEAGVGYRLEHGFDLPPLMFSEAEIEAIVLGSRMVTAFADPALAQAAEDVLVRLGYADGKRTDSTRLVRPLALSFVGHAWLLTAWCELRLAFRNFRLDRITSLAMVDATFAPETGKRWEDFLALMEQESAKAT
jgi:predicted DNA-binding transcriptional regulator YafY